MMYRSKYHILLTFLLLLTGVTTVRAQDYEKIRKELQKKQEVTKKEIDQLKSQINSYQKQISTTQEKFETLNNEYNNLEKEIALRNALLKKLQNEQDDIRQNIEVTRKSINAKEKEYERLTDNYRTTLDYLYKHGRESEIALILTSQSVNQMMIRSYYLRKFAEYRQNQLKQIRDVQTDLAQKKDDLENSRARNKRVIDDTQQQRQKLKQRTSDQKKLISALRKDKSNLENMLAKVRKQVDTLNNTLSRLIDQEDRVRKAEAERQKLREAERQRHLAEAKKITDPDKRKEEIAKYSKPVAFTGDLPTDEELDKMQKSFASDKGQLPWPVGQGVITTHFGIKINPVYGTRTKSLGIEITTAPHSEVHAVSDGYVFGVLASTGYGNLVLVNHGKYKTVFGNLSEVDVRKNEVVHAGDLIGLSGDKNSIKGETVFFMIRDGNKNVDPENWIQKK